MKMAWKDEFSFIAPVGVEHEVQGKLLKFYPISVKTAFAVKGVAAALVRALSTILKKHETDCSQKTKLDRDGKMQEVQSEAIDKNLAELRTKERERALEEAIQALLNGDNSLVIGRMLVDSLRDVPGRDKMTSDQIKAFVDELPLPALVEMLVGLAKGNKAVFGPLVEKAEGLLKKGLAAVAGNEEATPATTGEDSKTQS
jgi:hypothetical protein